MHITSKLKRARKLRKTTRARITHLHHLDRSQRREFDNRYDNSPTTTTDPNWNGRLLRGRYVERMRRPRGLLSCLARNYIITSLVQYLHRCRAHAPSMRSSSVRLLSSLSKRLVLHVLFVASFTSPRTTNTINDISRLAPRFNRKQYQTTCRCCRVYIYSFQCSNITDFR